ncbi:MAG: hypothetical protein AAF353_20425, partial [Pseudomonadota bacterium]
AVRSDYSNYIITAGGRVGINDGYLDNIDDDFFSNVEEFVFDLNSQAFNGANDYEGKLNFGTVLNGASNEVFSVIWPVPSSMVFGGAGTITGTIDLTLDIYLNVQGSTTPGGSADLDLVVETSPDTTDLPSLNPGYQYVEFQLVDDIGTQSKGFIEFNITTQPVSELVNNGGT